MLLLAMGSVGRNLSVRKSDAEKQDLATAITKRHCETTGASFSLFQLLFFFIPFVVEEEGMSKRFIDGLATTAYIWMRFDMRASVRMSGNGSSRYYCLSKRIAKASVSSRITPGFDYFVAGVRVI